MTCYHPLKGFVKGTTENGKKDLKICSYQTDCIELRSDNRWYAVEHIQDVSYIRSPYALKVIDEYVTIPCGQCIGCRIDYSREWANRMVLENLDHTSSYFITLTYNDEHLPESEYFSKETGEVCTSYTLVKRDFQGFMKRLRKHFPQCQIRFYACGEYGGSTKRPHYHAIIYGLVLDDLKFLKHNFEGSNYYTSDKLGRCWTRYNDVSKEYESMGFHIITEVNWQTCAYVARYVTKKLKGKDAEFYETFNLEPEFSLMSRRPGIAYNYYNMHKDDIYSTYIITLSQFNDVRKFKPPHYFDKLYDLEQPDVLAEIKENQKKMAENAKALKLEHTSLSYLEMLAVEEEVFKKKTNKLKRGDLVV